jgi:hypothetical protein
LKRITLADVRRVAKKHGATLDERHSGPSGRYFNICVDLPAGKTWNANGCHGVYASTHNGGAEDRAEACRDAIEQMEQGVCDCGADCGDPECDTCHPVDEHP